MTSPLAREPSRARAGGEIAGVVLTYAAWIVGEYVLKRKVECLGILVGLWVPYFLWRAAVEPGTWRAWGFRADNVRAALRIHLPVAAGLAASLAAAGLARGTLRVGTSFLILLAGYPVWALVQEFFLQNAVVRNVAALGAPPLRSALVGALCFAVAHAPDAPLMALTAAAGGIWTALYRKMPNLWVLAAVHATVGTLAFTWALGRDPFEEFPQLKALLGGG